MNVPPLFDFHSVTLTIVGINTVLAFNADRNRVSIIVSCAANPAVNVSLYASENPFSRWIALASPVSLTLPYRDYGPLIKESIYVAVGTNPTDVTITEVIQIPQYR